MRSSRLGFRRSAASPRACDGRSSTATSSASSIATSRISAAGATAGCAATVDAGVCRDDLDVGVLREDQRCRDQRQRGEADEGDRPSPTATRSNGCGSSTRSPPGCPLETGSRVSPHRRSITSPIRRSPRACSASTPTRCCRRDRGPPVPRDGTLLGALFESLVTLCVRVYAQACRGANGTPAHLERRREIDLIVERGRRSSPSRSSSARCADERDVRHLLWLRRRSSATTYDAVVITTGQAAYRRADGIAVVPAALLGP